MNTVVLKKADGTRHESRQDNGYFCVVYSAAERPPEMDTEEITLTYSKRPFKGSKKFETKGACCVYNKTIEGLCHISLGELCYTDQTVYVKWEPVCTK